MRHLLILSLLLSVNAAYSKEMCDFTLNCKNDGGRFTLEFKSASGDCGEDDMAVTMGKKKLKIKKQWYIYTNHIVKTQGSVCKGEGQSEDFTAYAVDDNRILLFVKSSGRPGYNFVNAILINHETKEVLDEKTLGTSKNEHIAVLKTEGGFRVRIIRDSLSFHKQVTCDCDAPFVDDWKEVSVYNNKIKTNW